MPSLTRNPVWLTSLGLICACFGFFAFVRLENPGKKAIWTDEVYTLIRASGQTRAAFFDRFNSRDEFELKEPLAALRDFSHATPSGTVRSILDDSPQHTPLYLVLVQAWGKLFSTSLASIRSLSILFSLLAIPAVFLLTRELFADNRAAVFAGLLTAASPIQLAYAHEARAYSFWAFTIALSSAFLLRALRLETKRGWAVYALAAALLLHSYLFSLFVLAAHALYVLAIRKGPGRRPFAIAATLALATFVPWLVVLLKNFAKVEESSAWSASQHSTLNTLVSQWVLHVVHGFVDFNYASLKAVFPPVSFALVLLTILSFLAVKDSPTRPRGFLIALALPLAAALGAADLALGGVRSTTVRYLFPSLMALHVAVGAYLARWTRKSSIASRAFGLAALGVLLVAGAASALKFRDSRYWWTKWGGGAHRAAVDTFAKSAEPLVLLSYPNRGEGMAHFYRLLTLGDGAPSPVQVRINRSEAPMLVGRDVFLWHFLGELPPWTAHAMSEPVDGSNALSRVWIE